MNDFRGMADERLKDLTFQPLVEKTAQAARRMSRPVKTRKTRLAVALALVLLAVRYGVGGGAALVPANERRQRRTGGSDAKVRPDGGYAKSV